MQVNPQDSNAPIQSFNQPVPKKGAEKVGGKPSKLKEIGSKILKTIKRPFTSDLSPKLHNEKLATQLKKVSDEIDKIDKAFKKSVLSEKTLDPYSKTNLKELKTEKEKLEFYDQKLREIQKLISTYKDQEFVDRANKQTLGTLQEKVKDVEGKSKNAREIVNKTINTRFEPTEILTIKVKRGVRGLFQTQKSIERKFDDIIKNLNERVEGLKSIPIHNISSIAQMESIVQEGDHAFSQIQTLKSCLKEFGEKHPKNKRIVGIQKSLDKLGEGLKAIRISHPQRLQELKNIELVNVTTSQMLKQAEQITELSKNATTFEQLIDLRAAMDDFEHIIAEKISSGFFKELGALKVIVERVVHEARTTIEDHSILKEDENKVLAQALQKYEEFKPKFSMQELNRSFQDQLATLDEKLSQAKALKNSLETYVIKKKPPADKKVVFQNLLVNIEKTIESLNENKESIIIEIKVKEFDLKSSSLLHEFLDVRYNPFRSEQAGIKAKNLLEEISGFLIALNQKPDTQRNKEIIKDLNITLSVIKDNLQESNISSLVHYLSYVVKNLGNEDTLNSSIVPERVLLVFEELSRLEKLLNEGEEKKLFLNPNHKKVVLEAFNRVKNEFENKVGLIELEAKESELIADYKIEIKKLQESLKKIVGKAENYQYDEERSLSDQKEKLESLLNQSVRFINQIEIRLIITEEKTFLKKYEKDFSDLLDQLNQIKLESEDKINVINRSIAESATKENLYLDLARSDLFLGMLRDLKSSTKEERRQWLDAINSGLRGINRILQVGSLSEDEILQGFKKELEAFTTEFKTLFPPTEEAKHTLERIERVYEKPPEIINKIVNSNLGLDHSLFGEGNFEDLEAIQNEQSKILIDLSALSKLFDEPLTFDQQDRISMSINKLKGFHSVLSDFHEEITLRKKEQELKLNEFISSLEKDIKELPAVMMSNPLKGEEKVKSIGESKDILKERIAKIGSTLDPELAKKLETIEKIYGNLKTKIDENIGLIEIRKQSIKYQDEVKDLVENWNRLSKEHESIKDSQIVTTKTIDDISDLINRLNDFNEKIPVLPVRSNDTANKDPTFETYLKYVNAIQESVNLMIESLKSQFVVNTNTYFEKALKEIKLLSKSKNPRLLGDKIVTSLEKIRSIQRSSLILPLSENEKKEISDKKKKLEDAYISFLGKFMDGELEKQVSGIEASLKYGAESSDVVSIKEIRRVINEMNALLQIFEAGSEIQFLTDQKGVEQIKQKQASANPEEVLKGKYDRFKHRLQTLSETYVIEKEYSTQHKTVMENGVRKSVEVNEEVGQKLVARKFVTNKKSQEVFNEIKAKTDEMFNKLKEIIRPGSESQVVDSKIIDSNIKEAEVLISRCSNELRMLRDLTTMNETDTKLIRDIETSRGTLVEFRNKLLSSNQDEKLKMDIENQVAQFLAPYLSGKISLDTPKKQQEEINRESLEAVILKKIENLDEQESKKMIEIAAKAFITEGVKNVYRIFLEENASYFEKSVKLGNFSLQPNSDLFQTFLERLYPALRRDFPDYMSQHSKDEINIIATNILVDIVEGVYKDKSTGRRGFM